MSAPEALRGSGGGHSSCGVESPLESSALRNPGRRHSFRKFMSRQLRSHPPPREPAEECALRNDASHFLPDLLDRTAADPPTDGVRLLLQRKGLLHLEPTWAPRRRQDNSQGRTRSCSAPGNTNSLTANVNPLNFIYASEMITSSFFC